MTCAGGDGRQHRGGYRKNKRTGTQHDQQRHGAVKRRAVVAEGGNARSQQNYEE